MSGTCTQVPHRLVPSYFHSLWLAHESEDLTKKIMVWCVLLWLTYFEPKDWEGDTQIYFHSRLKCVFGTASPHTLIIHSKKVLSSFFPDFCCQGRALLITPWGFFALCYPIPHSHLRHQDRWKQNRDEQFFPWYSNFKSNTHFTVL